MAGKQSSSELIPSDNTYLHFNRLYFGDTFQIHTQKIASLVEISAPWARMTGARGLFIQGIEYLLYADTLSVEHK